MTRDGLKSRTPEQLFTLFWEAARKGHFAARPTEYNRYIDKILAIVEEMQARTPDARRMLLPLLKDKNETVRYAAATNLLEIEEDQAAATLKDLRETGKSDAAHFAFLDLDEWERKKKSPGGGTR